jgi:hypothetical protein
MTTRAFGKQLYSSNYLKALFNHVPMTRKESPKDLVIFPENYNYELNRVTSYVHGQKAYNPSHLSQFKQAGLIPPKEFKINPANRGQVSDFSNFRYVQRLGSSNCSRFSRSAQMTRVFP